MRILFLTSQLPYPPKSGGLIKSWRLLEHLSKDHELTLVHPLKKVDLPFLEEFRKEGLPLKAHHHELVDRPRSAIGLMRAYLGHRSLNIYRNHSKVLMQRVRDVLPNIDLIFLDHYELGQYVPKDALQKIVLHEHNAEYVMWARLREIERNPVKKLILAMESIRIAAAERAYASFSDQVWAAPNDRIELEKIGVDPKKLRTTYHLGEDFMIDQPEMQFELTERKILYVGTLTWEANVDGLLWFFEKIWPALKSDGDLSMDIIGKNPDPRLTKSVKGDTKVRFLGFVDDLEPYYRTSRVFVVPLRFGSGIKVKLLNAMYRGIPTVTTEIGTEGLDIEEAKEIFQTSNPTLFAQHIKLLLNDREAWEKLSKASREKAKNYTWKQLLKNHDGHLAEL